MCLWDIDMWVHFKEQIIKNLQILGLLPTPELRVIPIRVRRKPMPRRRY